MPKSQYPVFSVAWYRDYIKQIREAPDEDIAFDTMCWLVGNVTMLSIDLMNEKLEEQREEFTTTDDEVEC